MTTHSKVAVRPFQVEVLPPVFQVNPRMSSQPFLYAPGSSQELFYLVELVIFSAFKSLFQSYFLTEIDIC